MKKATSYYLLVLIAGLLLTTSACKKKIALPQQTTDDKSLVKDIDGNVYHTVTIGVQTWMVENLKVTHYRNGDAISYSSTDLSQGAYCNYNNDTSIARVYGRLYNYDAINDSRGICPEGWHIPTDADWTQLDYTLNGENVAGGAMKEGGTAHWDAPNTGATNSSGFTGLPGGNAGAGQFNELGKYAFFWSFPGSTDSRALNYQSGASIIDVMNSQMNSFLSIRCVRNF